jgi:hypothetical protein
LIAKFFETNLRETWNMSFAGGNLALKEVLMLMLFCNLPCAVKSRNRPPSNIVDPVAPFRRGLLARLYDAIFPRLVRGVAICSQNDQTKCDHASRLAV